MAEAQAAMVSVRRDNTDPRISRGFPAGLQALLTPDALKLKAGRIKAAANLLVFCVTVPGIQWLSVCTNTLADPCAVRIHIGIPIEKLIPIKVLFVTAVKRIPDSIRGTTRL